MQKTPYSYVKYLTVKSELVTTKQTCSEDSQCVTIVNEAKFWTCERANEKKSIIWKEDFFSRSEQF